MTKSQIVYDALRQRIVDGEYTSGSSIKINNIAAEFGVSVGPVREALRRLEGHGLIRHEPNVGARVLGVDDTVFKETLEVMAVLEGLASGLSTPLLTAADRVALRDLNQEMATSSEQGDMQRYGELNRSFHRLLYARCPNTYLLSQIDACWDRQDVAHRSIFVRIPQRHKQSLAEHEEIITMVETGADPERIDEFIRAHKRRTLFDLLERERQEQERKAGRA